MAVQAIDGLFEVSCMTGEKKFLGGGEFLISSTEPQDVFTRDDVDETGRAIAETVRTFFEREVVVCDEQIESLDVDTIRGLMRRAGEVGLLGLEVPTFLGGFGQPKTTALLAAEAHVQQMSFASCLGVHCSVGMIPIVYFGSQSQREKYLPKLLSGEWIAAYCLTEPHCGSDAMAITTVAKLSADGRYYLLSGSKMWITNAGFADLFNVAAKVDGQHFTMFIVERSSPGITLGGEEKKMGLTGSSTRPVYFEEVKVPVENVLGEVGKGHHIAFNALNMGRLGIGALAFAQIRRSMKLALDYAKQRRAFGKRLIDFGLIKAKIAEMAIRAYAVESMAFRTAGMIDARLADVKQDKYLEASKSVLREYAIESSILKVYGSEAQGYAVDEAVQIFGGNGYSREYPVERDYRNVRPARIFEGTNEINRLLILEMLIKRAMQGQLPLAEVSEKVASDVYATGKLRQYNPLETHSDEPFAAERIAVENLKKATIMLLGLIVKRWGMDLFEQQEVVAALSELVIAVYAAESVLLRTIKAALEKTDVRCAMAQVFINDVLASAELSARYVLAATCSEDELPSLSQAVQRLLKWRPLNTFDLRRSIASKLAE
ncbi:MAG: acyl-CoA dehydrogenase family protein [Acidobacteriota bacterium]|nr:acyl-CoA dehydrogenase family protein [Blastocatellia bacterium]MDW8412138.1 acyl-CoA dehydrogenase family protein [Acidobacteriota bacterium]